MGGALATPSLSTCSTTLLLLSLGLLRPWHRKPALCSPECLQDMAGHGRQRQRGRHLAANVILYKGSLSPRYEDGNAPSSLCPLQAHSWPTPASFSLSVPACPLLPLLPPGMPSPASAPPALGACGTFAGLTSCVTGKGSLSQNLSLLIFKWKVGFFKLLSQV